MIRRRLAAWLAEAAVALFDLSERLDPIVNVTPAPRPRPAPSIIAPVGRAVGFDLGGHWMTKGGDA